MKDKTQPVLIIDAHNHMYRAFHAYSRLSHKGENVAIVYGLLEIVKYLITKYRPGEVFVVWDGMRSPHRIALLPGYKGSKSREDKKKLIDWENFDKQKNAARSLLHYLGVRQIWNQKAEADDMIYKLAIKVMYKKSQGDIFIASSDKDFHQMVGGRVKILNETMKIKTIITQDNCKELFGYHPRQTVKYLTLVGDDSDNIPGYKGIGPKKAMDLINKYHFLKRVDIKAEGLDAKRFQLAIEQGKELIDLDYYYEKYKHELKTEFYRGIKSPKLNKEKFLKLCGIWGMNKFMGGGFLEPFKRLQKVR